MLNFYRLNLNTDFNALCDFIKPHKIGQKIMQNKNKINFIFIKDIKAPAANILKQDALRVGAELITNKDVIFGKNLSNALLMATQEQIERLIQKEKNQDFGLKELSKFLKLEFNKPKKVKLMAVLNINDDSFNPQSRVNEKDFEKRLNDLLALKPDYIDIGAVSSKPGSVYCGKEEEFKRLKNILDLIYKKSYFKESIFSLDSFDEYCLEYALNKGFKLINDIMGFKNENLANLALKYKASYVLMHIQNIPQNMQDNPHYDDLILEIDEFFKEKLQKLQNFGLEDVILDLGIGFGKTPTHNILLIKHLEHFLHFKKEILIGASRKSVINHYFESKVEQRLSGTLYLHTKAMENGASIIRVHDLYEHKQILALHEAMQKVSFYE